MRIYSDLLHELTAPFFLVAELEQHLAVSCAFLMRHERARTPVIGLRLQIITGASLQP